MSTRDSTAGAAPSHEASCEDSPKVADLPKTEHAFTSSEFVDTSNGFHEEQEQLDEQGFVAHGTESPESKVASESAGDTSEPIYLHYIGEDKPMPACPGDERDYLLAWVGRDDPGLPTNWKMFKKIYVLSLCAITNLCTVLGSAIIGPGTDQIMHEYHVGRPVAILNISLFVLGFALGPMVWGPLSEITGRKLPIAIGTLGITIFAFACASAANFQTLVLCRFFGGAFGAATITVVPAVISDLFSSTQRGKAMAIVCLMIFAGPMLAPVIGAYISASFLGWRWTQYIWGIFGGFCTLTCVFIKETYGPRLLADRAQEIRQRTGNWSVAAPLERSELDTKEIVQRTVLKPIRMLIVEPILLLISIYLGFIYGILYLCLEAVPIIFGDYGWKGGNIYLPYIGMLVGTIASGLVSAIYFESLYAKQLAASPYSVIPEARLPLMMLSGVSFPIGIFLLCWSGAYKVFWFVPTIGCFFIGFGLLGIFLSSFNYIIDSYLTLAASAMAANTFLRSGFGAGFPLFVYPMFKNLGTQWAGTLLGCLASILAPVPFIFYVFGARIRTFSKYAANLEVQISQQQTRTSQQPSRN